MVDGTKARLYVGENGINHGDAVDLTNWLGKGIDDWVWASITQMQAFLSGGTQTQASVFSYGRQGMPTFFKFIVSTNANYLPSNLTPQHIRLFVSWLTKRTDWTTVTKRNRYSSVKTMLLGMWRRGVIPFGPDEFPNNPFPDSAKGTHGETALSLSERERLAEALRLDIVALHHGAFSGNDSDGLTVYVLALGLRTGLNTTPMLELKRNAISPHPFMPSMRIICSFKRRNNTTGKKSLRSTRVEDTPTSVPMDGVALFEKVIKQTQPLLAEVDSSCKNRLWLYRVEATAKRNANVVQSLNTKSLASGIASLIKRHKLIDDAGKCLRLNISRLRKTMENRLWLLSNGDLFTVSLIMGHTPKVADEDYLHVTPAMRQNATIVGEALPQMYRSGAETKDTQRWNKLKLESTPVGSCKDSLFGDLAPKNGINHCMDFTTCFQCRAFAVVGSLEDLHRLFSFYWFTHKEMERTDSQEWREQFAWTIAQIDAFTKSNFDINLVNEAKQLAKDKPHPFWRDYSAGTAND